mmetsp:Transcript_24516/g.37132  ORF Transcript_24516/g.37132 Transcript_24516/m.37132 type:complete len:151 (+) Transcript_24516:69-521(+)
MATDLIVDFPLQRQRNHHQVVRFAETAQLYIVERRHEDNEDRNKLWYTKSDYNSMKRTLKQDVLQARAGDALSEEDSGFWIGIAHLLTTACMLEVKACRFLCVRAVLAEQARQSSSTSFRWENIALASLAQTRKAVLRARKLGKLHQESI